jgi:hypothetical protein
VQCVVCGAVVSEPVYANAWERARKQLACCGAACSTRFNPDDHWIPSMRPAAVAHDEEARLVRLGGERLRAGDQARLVTRDLLVAGASILAVRKVLINAGLDADQADAAVRKLGVLGLMSGALGGMLRLFERSDKQDQAELRTALATDLVAWAARYPRDDR